MQTNSRNCEMSDTFAMIEVCGFQDDLLSARYTGTMALEDCKNIQVTSSQKYAACFQKAK